MQQMNFYSTSDCVCSKCGQVFNSEEAKESTRKLYGISITEKTCPHCGNTGFSNISMLKSYNKGERK